MRLTNDRANFPEPDASNLFIMEILMTKPKDSPIGMPAKDLKVTSSDLPQPHTPEHDEWLLDEALGETFPASDPIAVPSDSPDPKESK